MKTFYQYLIVLVLGLVQIALAVEAQKSIVVSYPDETPNSVLDEAKQAIIDAVSTSSLLHYFTVIMVIVHLLMKILRAAGSRMNFVSQPSII